MNPRLTQLLYSFSIFAMSFFPATYASSGSEPAGIEPYCGYPLLPGVESFSDFHAAEVDASQNNLVFFEKLLGQQKLTETDQQLIEQFKKFPPYMIRRSSSEYLCSVLTDGAIHSNGSNTPFIEKSLYNADSCVFTSLGSPVGQPQWGDVLITFDSSKMTDTWATPHSGWYYVMSYELGETPIGGLSAELLEPATDNDREFMQQFIFTSNQWQDYMVDFFMLKYKALPIASQNAISTKLLGIDDRHDFQMEVFNQNMGYYLEVHANKSLSLDTALTIQIPKSKEAALEAECPSAYEKWKGKMVLEE